MSSRPVMFSTSARHSKTDAMTAILHRFALGGPPWPTFDPYLFCVHHNDAYPVGNGTLGPDPYLLVGRPMGNDFSAAQGWSMYHGSTVPGFPQHPHRGFETVTFVRHGLVDHSDSLRATARYGAGDTQWLTAGAGILHAEMFPLVRADAENPMELFQIWMNLPRADKMAEPYFAMLWAEDIPIVSHHDASGLRTTITVVAGAVDGHVPPNPPPNSWASRPEADVAIWRIASEPNASWTLPTANDETIRTLYVFEGALTIEGEPVDTGTGVVVDASRPITIAADDDGATVLVLQGRPIGEPVAQYGPFVMNDRAGIEQAFTDYQQTQFGGWPWPDDAPTHGLTNGRFARRPDGSLELPPGTTETVIG
jgi:quercetin 2,3-dioxygenase